MRVVILNGVGSVGKSSTAKALQSLLGKPYLHVQGDAFLEMLPEKMFGHPDGIIFKNIQSDGGPSIEMEMGVNIDKMLRGMRRSVAALADEGNDLIVDDVMLESHEQQFYHSVLAEHEVSFVGLFAPLEILEKREKERGDRLVGLARWQVERAHDGFSYDLKIDTADASLQECANQIATALELLQCPLTGYCGLCDFGLKAPKAPGA